MQGKFFRISGALLFTLCFAVGILSATEPIYNVRQLTKEDGLSNNNVEALYQDDQGFIWIGTRYGLNRFDGVNFLSFYKESHGLSSNEVNQIYMDDGGWLWLIQHKDASDRVISIDLFNPHTFEAVPLSEKVGGELPDEIEEIEQVLELPNRQILIVTKEGQCWRYNAESGFTRVILPPSVQPIKIKSKGSFWGIRADTLLEMDHNGQALRSLPFKVETSILNIIDLGQDQWLVLQRDSLRNAAVMLDLAGSGAKNKVRLNSINEQALLSNSTILLLPPYDNLLIMVPGFTLLDSALNIKFQIPEQEWKMRRVVASLVDRENLLWVGGAAGLRMIQIRESKFETYLKDIPSSGQFSRNPTRAIFETENQLLISERQHLYSVDQDGDANESQIIESANRVYYAMAPDDKGGVWIAGGALLHFSAEREKQLKEIRTSPQRKRINALYQDQLGGWWVGQFRGLAYCNDLVTENPQPYERLNGFDDLREARIEHIQESDGYLWLATTAGLFQLEPEQRS